MGLLYGESIIESQQFTEPGVMEEFYKLALHYEKMLTNGERGNCLKGKAVGMVFYEPSTRTRWSFEAAVRNLSGDYSSTENAGEFSSAAKGERLEHSVRVMSKYVDAIVLRHKENNAAERARDYLQSFQIRVPIFNAGCGTGQHPTQAKVDWFTVRKHFGRTSDLRILIVGDVKRGRTARSMFYLFGREPGVSIDICSPVELAMDPDILAYGSRHGVPVRTFYQSLDECIADADVVYMTRVQKERLLEGVSLDHIDASAFRLTVKRAQAMKETAIAMHPMPIVDEIEEPVDRLLKSKYFEQSDNGVPVRMALLDMVMCRS